jgi:hypothetical protein
VIKVGSLFWPPFQFLLQFALQSLPWCFSRFDFSTEKGPAIGIRYGRIVVTKLKKVLIVFMDNGLGNYFHSKTIQNK